MMENQAQYLRACSVIVQDAKGNGLELSSLCVKFSVKKTSDQTPNSALIRVYNLNDDTQNQIKGEFKTIILQAGYQSNFGLIFSGNIITVRSGKENATDRYLDIYAGDGDEAYNFCIVNRTLASGATQKDQIMTCADSMSTKGVGVGVIDEVEDAGLPRGKVMFGMSRDYLRTTAVSTDTTWSIQNRLLQVVRRTSVLPNEAVVLNSNTGLINNPTQTDDGVEAEMLLNPLVQINGKVQISEQDISQGAPSSGGEPLPQLSSDGIYRVLSVNHVGDTYGQDWTTKIVCIGVDATAPKGNQVKKA